MFFSIFADFRQTASAKEQMPGCYLWHIAIATGTISGIKKTSST